MSLYGGQNGEEGAGAVDPIATNSPSPAQIEAEEGGIVSLLYPTEQPYWSENHLCSGMQFHGNKLLFNCNKHFCDLAELTIGESVTK